MLSHEEDEFARNIDVLTINEGPKNVEELLEVVERAGKYFPKGAWGEIEYLGNVSWERDFRIALNKKLYEALMFEKMIRRIRKIKEAFRAFELLLGVTRDPVVDVRLRFEGGTMRRLANLVYDYVSKDVGIVSLFRIDKEAGDKLTAHGLGHGKGLRHHADPIDLMYIDLLRNPAIKEPFCEECLGRLKKMG